MKNHDIAKIIKDDKWTVAEGETEGFPVVVRFREQLRMVDDTSGYEDVLTIFWAFAEPGEGTLPDVETTAELEEFEERMLAAFEHDAHAVLTAVVTADGARQWIVYTDDVDECDKRLADMPQDKEAYPIEMETEEDPEWSFFHEVIGSESEDDEDEE